MHCIFEMLITTRLELRDRVKKVQELTFLCVFVEGVKADQRKCLIDNEPNVMRE